MCSMTTWRRNLTTFNQTTTPGGSPTSSPGFSFLGVQNAPCDAGLITELYCCIWKRHSSAHLDSGAESLATMVQLSSNSITGNGITRNCTDMSKSQRVRSQ